MRGGALRGARAALWGNSVLPAARFPALNLRVPPPQVKAKVVKVNKKRGDIDETVQAVVASGWESDMAILQDSQAWN
eukprot:3659063-Alexandrium_andersonii.AAC.1